MKYIGTVVLLLFGSMMGGAQELRRPDTHEDQIRVEEIPSMTIVYREVAGDYSLHPKVFLEMMEYSQKRFSPVGACFGIYPIDPDSVESPAQLKWEVGVAVAHPENGIGGKVLPSPTAPYRLKELPATQAAVLETDVENAGKDGLAMFRWVVEHGFVQIAPTRMEYVTHAGDPAKIKTRIVIPIKKRRSGLSLLPIQQELVPANDKDFSPRGL
jgi:DNA gyrase inhibitor GyrI